MNGFSNLEESSEWVEDDRESISSVVHRSVITQGRRRAGSIVFPEEVRADMLGFTAYAEW